MPIAVEQLLTADINRPARYLGNELGAVHKPWDSANVRWVLTYPEIYEVGASNLGHIILYSHHKPTPHESPKTFPTVTPKSPNNGETTRSPAANSTTS